MIKHIRRILYGLIFVIFGGSILYTIGKLVILICSLVGEEVELGAAIILGCFIIGSIYSLGYIVEKI